MKIGIDCRFWQESGVGRYIRNLVLNLLEIDKKNDYILFVDHKDYENLKSQISNLKSDVKLVKTNIIWHSLEEQLLFPSILKNEQLDLVHFPYFSLPIFYNRPFIVTIHDLILHHFPTGEASTLPLPIYASKLFAYKYIIKQGAKKAKKIITVSNATKNEIVDHLKIIPEKIVVTYEGIDKKISNSQYSISSIKNIKGNYFLHVGNVYPHKNVDRLLESFSKITSDLQDCKLVFVGDEDFFYKRLQQKVSDYNLQNHVIFYGKATDEKLAELYKNAIALVIPSLMEGFGLPALEAMAKKCLVIASAIPSLKEICDNAAVYFDPLNTDDLTNTLQDVYKNKKKFDKNITIGLQRTKLFSFQKMARETLKVYESCIGI